MNPTISKRTKSV